MRKKDNTDYYINRHSCFLLQYHIVFVTKYRHPVLTGKVKDVVYERIHYVADQRTTGGDWIWAMKRIVLLT